MVLDTSLLSTQQYKVRIEDKVEQSTRCSSYWKRSLLVTLDYSRQLYFLHIKKRKKNLFFENAKCETYSRVEDGISF